MIVSWNWLAEYVRLDMRVEALTERLALAGLNHESTSEVGGDLAIDLEVTSNRPDCLSHIGIAREIGVLFDRPLRVGDPRPRESGEAVDKKTAVTVETPELCPRFTARVISNVTLGESPWWLKKRLETLGVRPISNIVDITNYVLFECGQPLHAYDLGMLSEKRLVVRHAREREKLRAINGRVYELTPEMLVIADAERPVGLAGVMGGLDTEIGPRTKNVLIEAARFDIMSVRRTSRALGLSSPSSYRFERPMDPERTEWASRRCAELILELAGGRLHPGVIDTGAAAPERPAVTLRIDQIPRVLGIRIEREESARILEALGMKAVAATPTTLTFQPPSWRSDLEREIDLIEEVARVHGYEHIPEDRPVPLARSSRGPRERVESAVREALCGLGFDEAYTFSLVAEESLAPLGTVPSAPPLRVDHSSRKKENVLRQSLVPSLLGSRAHNEAHGTFDSRLFEIAHVYLPAAGAGLPIEPARLAIVAGLDFLALKGIVEGLLVKLQIADELEAIPVGSPLFADGRAAELRMGGATLGWIGEIAPDRIEAFGLRSGCAAVELEFDQLIGRAILVPQARALAEFPGVARDLSLIVARDLPWSRLAAVARKAGGTLLEAIEFLDTFAGGDIPPQKHSLHFGMRFRDPRRTLTGEEVDRAVHDVVKACSDHFEATLRAGIET